ncbi:hypothetical protein AGMMS49992_28270 [Clostridia bacterium]|nr:hypothetical protein AGMMS49992_28270 [Clostridia bacterium]
MKICVIGCGSHSSFVHGPSYRKYAALHPDIHLAACCDLNLDAAKAYAQAFGFERTYTDFSEMIVRERPDMVGVVVPVALTCGIIQTVLRAGIPCLAEKPPALTGEDAQHLANVVKETAMPFRAAFNRRYTPLVRVIKTQLQNAEDPIQYIHYGMHRMGRNDADFSTTAIHGVDLVRYLADAPYASVRLAYDPIHNSGKECFNIYLDGCMENGVRVRLDFLPLTGLVSECVGIQTNRRSYSLELPIGPHDALGRLVTYENKELVSSITSKDCPDGVEFYEANGFYYEIASFLDQLRTGTSETDGMPASYVQSVALAEAIRLQKKKFGYK